MIGREAELTTLMTSLADARAGRGQLAVITGEAGMGKTRLADAFGEQARARGARVAWGRCWEAGGAPAYWPWIQVIRACLRDANVQSDPRLERSRSVLAPLIEPGSGRASSSAFLDPERDRFTLYDAVANVLRSTAAGTEVAVILDDLHAGDESSLLLVRYLSNELADSRVMLVAIYREPELSAEDPRSRHLTRLAREPAAVHIQLAPLTASEVAQVIEGTRHEAPSPALVRAIVDRTEGNPLFVQELSRLRIDGPTDPGKADDALRLALPSGIRQVIGRRLEALSDASRSVLGLAAIVGRDFGADLLLELGVPRSELLAALDDGVAARIIYEAPIGTHQWHFAHVLIRDVLYEEHGLHARMALHVRVGRAIERLTADGVTDHVSELAHHFMHGLPGGDAARARRYSTLAGRQATASAAHEEAVRHHANALAAFDEEPNKGRLRPALLIDLGEAQQRAGMPPAASKTLLEAGSLAERLGDFDALARAALAYSGSPVWLRPGLDRELVPYLERALAMRPPRDDELSVRLLARLAGALRSDPDVSRRSALSEQAIAIARRLDDAAVLIYALISRQMAIGGPDSLGEMEQLSGEMTALVDAAADQDLLGDVVGWSRASWLTTVGPPLVELEGLITRAGDVVEPLRLPTKSWYVGVMRTVLLLATGRYDGIDGIIEATRVAGRRGREFDADVSYRLARFALARERDELGEVMPLIVGAVDELPGYWLFEAARVYAEVVLGRPAEARSHLARLVSGGSRTLPHDNQWLWALVHLGEAAIALQDRETCEGLLAELLPYKTLAATAAFEVVGGPVGRVVGDLAATLGRSDVAEGAYAAALELTQRTGWRPWEAWTRMSYGSWLMHDQDRGDEQRAAIELHRAAEIADELDMPALRRRLHTVVGHARTPPISVGVPTIGAGRSGSLVHEGDVWALTFEGRTFRTRASKGLAYIAILLANPGREIAAIDISTLSGRAGRLEAVGSAHLPAAHDPIIDARARSAYRERLIDLEDEIAEAVALGDDGRASSLRTESEFLSRELAGAIGLHGRTRGHVHPAERARQSVTKAIRAALSRIEGLDPPLGDHLRHSLRTGVMCSYSPDPHATVDWIVVEAGTHRVRSRRHQDNDAGGRNGAPDTALPVRRLADRVRVVSPHAAGERADRS